VKKQERELVTRRSLRGVACLVETFGSVSFVEQC